VSLTLVCLQAFRMLTLEPEHLKNQPTTTRERIRRRWKGSSPETLKRLVL
jgi:hypothetical protein